MGRSVEDGPPASPQGGAGGAEPPQRLMISKMVLENFKSYAGVQHVGPFHKCFSSVVGPNGSGKSNVIDAMLFVFGKRAKQLRLNKVSELIHNSTNYRDLDFARVSVHFQKIIDLEGEEYEVVPNSEFVITRTAYRNNSSKYTIDNATSTFTDVTKLLKAEGIDLDNNRFLILQGEVEQIAMMKPKGQTPTDEGLLEYLEDIIGTNKYVEPIQQSAARLDELNEKRASLVQRVKMAEKDRDSLEEEKKEAVSFMLKEAELAKWSRLACAVSLRDAIQGKARLTDKVEQLEKDLEAELAQSEAARTELAELTAAAENCGQEYETARAEMEKAQAEFRDFEKKDVKLKEELKHCKSKLKKLEDRLAKDTAKLQETENATADAGKAMPQLEKDVARLTAELAKEEEKLEGIQEEIRGEVEVLQQKLEPLRKKLQPWEAKLSQLEAASDVTRTRRNLITEKHEAAKAQYEAASNGITEKTEAAKEKRKALKEMQSLEGRLKKEIAQLQAQEQASAAQVNEKTATAEQIRSRLAELKESATSERTQNAVMTALKSALESGEIPGIFGRLGDLGAIEAKYDVAISTACGALDYVVVDTTTTAQNCVELLRKKELGVSTFLILDKQQQLVGQMNQPVQTPEGVPRLFDLVKVADERLKLAFYFALRDTVVAKDVEQGTRIAYGADKRFKRVVTLNGELFESSGTMSGGGGKPRGGKMGTQIRPLSAAVAAGIGAGGGSLKEAVAKLEREVAQAEAELQAAVKEQQRARTQAAEASKKLEQLVADIPKTQLEIDGLGEQVQELQGRLGQLKAAAEPSKAELDQIKALEKQLQEQEAAVEACKEEFAPLQQQADELQKSIDEAGKIPLAVQRERIAHVQKELTDTQTKINQAKAQLNNSDKVVARLQKSIKEATKEKESEAETAAQKKEELKQVEKEAFAVHETYLRINEILAERREQHETAKKQHTKLKSQVDKLRAGEVEIQLKLDDSKKQLKACIEGEKGLGIKLKALDKSYEQQIAQLEKDGITEEEREEVLGPDPDEDTLPRDEALQKELEVKAALQALKPNLGAIEEYRKKQTAYLERVVELEGVTGEREDARKAHEELRKKRLDEFMAGFNIISTRLKEMYQMITLGGDAELELVDSLDPFSEGIVFSVRPPKKSWKNICNLSGGEKTLSSLALVFALHHYKPTPLYVMDEIDAALDFKNVSIVAHYIKDRTKNAQFVIISLRNNMFELADHLVGIYKTHNCTKSITINPHAFTVGASAHSATVPESSAAPSVGPQSEIAVE